MSTMTERPFSDIAYNQYLNEERLMGSRCAKCGAHFVPPRPMCIRCFSTDLEWIEVEGIGRLVAFTCIAIAPPFMAAQGYDRKHPYISGVIELDSGGRVDARIEELDPQQPELIQIGMRMESAFIHRTDTEGRETYLAFKPA
jgi:uncharacterized OB-fold protein